MKSRMLLIDGDIPVYRMASVTDTTLWWDQDHEVGTHVVAPFEEAAELLDDFITGLIKSTKAKEYFVLLSHPLNFRYKVLPTYKHNRTASDPEHRDALKEYVRETHPWGWLPECEADDCLGIYGTSWSDEYDTIIATIDKDLRQVPGTHYNWNSGKTTTISPEQADRWFYMQCLMGDPTDGYTGIPRVGPKNAEKILDAGGCNWETVLAAYEAKGLTEEFALQQARVARILRKGDYNMKTKEVKLWTP